MKYIYSTSQISKLSLILYTFSITSSVADLFLTQDSNTPQFLLLSKPPTSQLSTSLYPQEYNR